ncbi:hypothetical protein VY88_30360 [Azospirillum thiophilum]|uniref:SAF domain-containing protein n=1 Tax=Azospirillum thiophilum TaxID=528244 RepID=A0AAC9EYE9_9PROT|nr:Flp pilus assembly protein CpaB [Azospirillum thiophilum]ALG74529.1 hypothetical protein AL072_26265 [Azospirillum thiophilum]KJR61702.1 hypothetical protein VY88_30360 [Azospirillum thiophilum]
MALRILFLAMLFAGLSLVGYIAFGMLPGQPPTVAEAPATLPPSDQVLVAARPMSPGMLLRTEDVRWENWPIGRTPEGALVRSQVKEEAYRGAVMRRSFAAGEPIIAGQIVAPGERGFLAAVLSPGTRAVAVAVDAVSATGGLIWPGDRVDLILTQNFEGEQGRSTRKAVGETVLGNLRVIAIDQQLGEAPTAPTVPAASSRATPEARVPRTVTLEVAAQQGEAVAVAASIGKLSLALRSLATDEPAAGGGGALAPAIPIASATWAEDVSPALRALPRPPAADPAPHVRPAMLIIRGSKTETLQR